MISPEYRELNRQLHVARSDYGYLGYKWQKLLSPMIRDGQIKSVLDYGCGKATLEARLLEAHPELKVISYDPCIPGREYRESCDLVVCADVLEHVEPEFLADVLDDLKMLTKRAVFFAVGTTPASKTLPDGRNAHLTVQGPELWLPLLWDWFELQSFHRRPTDFIAVMT